MQRVVSELADLATASNAFASYHGRIPNFSARLRGFLSATMDEVRLSRAGNLTHDVLLIIDLDDAEYFREGVLKREISGAITYQSQRDHSAHTLYNWLLGWYFYEHADAFSQEMKAHIERRGWPTSSISVNEYFGHVWQYVSILHDVGYLFEGSLALFDPDTQSRQTEVGIKIVKEYFESRFWLECGLSSIHERNILQTIVGVVPPKFEYGQSLGRIADTLRDLGDLGHLSKSVKEHLLRSSSKHHCTMNMPVDGLPRDAFDLWEINYEAYGQKGCADRIRCVRRTFETLLYRGLPELGLRVLDHGVCSGLVLLLLATYYYRLRYATEEVRPRAGEEQRIVNKLRARMTAYDYDPLFWWSGIVWATAATAVHNLQQMKRPWPPGEVDSGRLTVTEDPLAYLGVLVDCVQEWDRYFVFPLSDRLPIQGVDVELGYEGGRVVITYPDVKRAQKVRAELSVALDEWDRLVEIR